MPTAGAIVQRVINASGRSDLSTDILNLINELIVRFCIEFNFPLQEQIKTRATVVGSDRYAVPSDQIDWRAMFIVDTDGITEDELVLRSRAELEVMFGLDTSAAARGKPEFVAFEHQEYMVRPVPDLTTYTLRLHYYTAPVALASSDSNEFTNRWARVVECGVLSELYMQIGNEKLYDFWNKQYLFEYEKMKLSMRKQQLKSTLSLPIRKGPRLSSAPNRLAQIDYTWSGQW